MSDSTRDCFVRKILLVSAYPETPSMAFRGVGIKKCHFLFLAKSITGVFDFGGTYLCRVSTDPKTNVFEWVLVK